MFSFTPLAITIGLGLRHVMACAWVGVCEHVHEHNLLIELELVRTSDDPMIMADERQLRFYNLVATVDRRVRGFTH